MEGYQTVAVIGAGVMGHGLALVHALGGCDVRLCDTSQERLDWALARLDELSKDLEDMGVVDRVGRERIRVGITPTLDRKIAVQGVDLVVEAIVEDADAKADLYRQLAQEMGAGAVLASNTSFLDIFPLLPDQLRARTLIVHWYTPPYLIDLVDVVPCADTAPGVTERMIAFLRGIGKRPVKLKKFVPGYIANNVQMAIESEIFRLLDDGVAEVSEIDDAIRFGLAQRLCLMGQFKKIDYTGLQVVRDIHSEGLYTPPEQPTGSKALDQLLSQGANGLLSGKGFYDYGQDEGSAYLKRRDRKLARLKSLVDSDDSEL